MAQDEMMEEEFDDVVILVDEEEQEHAFVIIDMLEVDGSQYAILSPLEEEEESDDAIILRIAQDENGEEMLYDIEDDTEWQKVVDVWNASIEE